MGNNLQPGLFGSLSRYASSKPEHKGGKDDDDLDTWREKNGLGGFRNSLNETFKFPEEDLLAFAENQQPKSSIILDGGNDNKINTQTKLECAGWIVENYKDAVGSSLTLQNATFFVYLTTSYEDNRQKLLKTKLDLSRIFLRTPSPKFRNTGQYPLSVELNAIDTRNRESATAVHIAFASVDDYMVWLERMKLLVMHYELGHFKVLHDRLESERGSWTDDNGTDVRVGYDDDMTRVSLGMQTQNTHTTNIAAIPTFAVVDVRQSDNISERKKRILLTVEEPESTVLPFSDAVSSANESTATVEEQGRHDRRKSEMDKITPRVDPGLSDLSAYMSEASEHDDGTTGGNNKIPVSTDASRGEKRPWISRTKNKKVTLTVETKERTRDTLTSASAVADPDDINAFLSDHPDDDDGFNVGSKTKANGSRIRIEDEEERHSNKDDFTSHATRTPVDGLTLNLDFPPVDEVAMKEAGYHVALDSGKSGSLAGYVIEDAAASVGPSARTPARA